MRVGSLVGTLIMENRAHQLKGNTMVRFVGRAGIAVRDAFHSDKFYERRLRRAAPNWRESLRDTVTLARVVRKIVGVKSDKV